MASQQQSVEQLFSAALDLAPERRGAFLDRACRGAPALRRLVEQLLIEDERAGSFLNKPIFDLADKEPVYDLGSPSAVTIDTVPASAGSRAPRPPAPPRFGSGQTIADRFTVVRFIARGGMGEVYEVEDRFLQGDHVALKMILPEIAADADASHRFEQEVLLARKINHPALCPIYDIFHCQEPPPAFLFLTMKLLAGETLGARLRNFARIPREDALEIFRQLISGIAAIHAAGVIHRDIKPNNVMLDPSGPRLCVSILDFGLARLHEAESTLLQPGTVAGTPGYLAPELLHGQRPSQCTDIFALGVVLHQVFTGERPVESRDGLSSRPASSLNAADIPPLYLQAVRDFLSDDPQRRCSAFSEIHTALDAHSSTHHLATPAPRLWTRRNFAITSAASALALTGGAIWKHDQIYDLFHPLPSKRFVAILGWPPTPDPHLKPMLLGLIDAMANELSRAEAFDHNLFVAAQHTPTDMTTTAQLNDVRESLGANLVLATSGIPVVNGLRVILQVLDPANPASRPLRVKEIHAPLDQQFSLPERVVRVASELLDVSHYDPDDKRSRVGTDNPEALASYQSAEALMKQPNNTGLDAAIEKYKQAVDTDRHFALAHAHLAGAYALLYELRRDPSSMILARANADTAITLNPKSVESHVALGSVLWEANAYPEALREMDVALSLDPSDTRTMTRQAQIYSAQNRWLEAEQAFKRVLRLRPNHWLAYNELGNNYTAQANYVDALAAYRAAAAAAPGRAIPLSNIAMACFQLGSLTEALAAVDKSIALAPLDGTYQIRSDILRAQGRYPEALKAALEGAKRNPGEAANWLEVGDAYASLPHREREAIGAYRRAAEVQEKQFETQPGDGPGWMLLALYRIKSGSPEKALALIKKAESLGAGDMSSQLVKVRILELLGRHDEALTVLSTLMRKGVTISQLRAIRDLDSLRTDPRFSGLTSINGVPPQKT